MDTTPTQQIVNLIKNKEKILLISHRKPDGDSLGSLLSLYLVLKSIGKDVVVASSDPVPDVFNFLPSLEVIQTNFSTNQDFIITLDCKNAEVDKLKYNLDDNKVNIIVSPSFGVFTEKDVSFSRGGSQFDLILVLDSADLEQIGSIYEKNTELFFSAPVLNIDHHASNTFFGNINLVEITAASTTEIIVDLIKKIERVENRSLITEDVATLLLTGIITDTSSFQNPNTTPKSFDIAADLIDLGAHQQEIIQNIYKTKKVSTLKLWGQTLSKIQIDPIHRLVWSTITKHDLNETGAHPDESAGIIDELMSNAPGAEIILLFKDNLNGVISGSLRTTSANIDASKIAQLFGGGGHLQASGFKLKNGKDFELHLAEVLQKIRQFQAKRLNLPESKQETKEILEADEIILPIPKKKEPPEKPATAKNSQTLSFGKKEETETKKSIDVSAKLNPKQFIKPEEVNPEKSLNTEPPQSEIQADKNSKKLHIPQSENENQA